MTDFAALDQTRLRDVLGAILDVLTEAAAGAGWVPDETAVTLVAPGYGCDGIYVWPSSVTPIPTEQRCVVVASVDVRWAVALCVGSDANETADWWRDRVDLLDPLWGVLGGIYASVADQSMHKAIDAVAGTGRECSNVRIGRADRFDSGDVLVWEGTLSVAVPA